MSLISQTPCWVPEIQHWLLWFCCLTFLAGSTLRIILFTGQHSLRNAVRVHQEVLSQSVNKFWKELYSLDQKWQPGKHAFLLPQLLTTINISCIFKIILMRSHYIHSSIINAPKFQSRESKDFWPSIFYDHNIKNRSNQGLPAPGPWTGTCP